MWVRGAEKERVCNVKDEGKATPSGKEGIQGLVLRAEVSKAWDEHR